jgi:predicted O-methyltransferase YrrM
MTVVWDGKSNRRYFLDWLIKKHNIKTMAEVGVRDGRTTFYLLDQNPELIIYAVDKSIAGFYNKEIQIKYADRLIPVEAMSTDGATHITNNSLDLVFIDADHSYEWVKKDIAAYKPKLKSNGWLTGHDIDFPGVNRAVNEIVKKYDIGPNNVWLTQYT